MSSHRRHSSHPEKMISKPVTKSSCWIIEIQILSFISNPKSQKKKKGIAKPEENQVSNTSGSLASSTFISSSETQLSRLQLQFCHHKGSRVSNFSRSFANNAKPEFDVPPQLSRDAQSFFTNQSR
jgi:hypothetical protein